MITHVQVACQGRRFRGFAAVYTCIMMVGLCAIVSLGVDLGRVQCAKTELHNAADAAVRAAANSLATSVSAARTAAQNAAADNTCDGNAVSLTPSTDLAFGSWNSSTKTFTQAASGQEASATALKATLSRSSTNGIPLVFGSLIGKSKCNITATAIAVVTTNPGNGTGFVGLNGMTFKNNTDFASYSSSVTTYPSTSSGSNAIVQTNGVLSVKNNTVLRGDLKLGPSGSTSGGVSVTGTTTNLSSAVATPASPTWAPTSNPNGVAQAYTVNSNTTLPGGTYWFTSLTLNNNLSFSGAATLYVNGNITINGDLTAYNRIPSNLTVHVIGSSRTFGDSSSNNVDVVGVISAPGTDASFKNNATFYGSATFKTILGKNNATFFYDQQLGSSSASTSISQVK